MNIRKALVALCISFACLLTVACSPTSQDISLDDINPTTTTERDVQREVRSTGETLADYADTKKDKFQNQAEANLDRIENRIDRLKAQAEAKGEEAQANLESTVDKLQAKADDIRSNLSDFADNTDSAGDRLEDGIESAINSLKLAVDDAARQY